jgi:hypothetical protein
MVLELIIESFLPYKLKYNMTLWVGETIYDYFDQAGTFWLDME